jgi:hypothetical protein
MRTSQQRKNTIEKTRVALLFFRSSFSRSYLGRSKAAHTIINNSRACASIFAQREHAYFRIMIRKRLSKIQSEKIKIY